MQPKQGLGLMNACAQTVAHLENFRCRFAIPEMPLRYDAPVDLVKSELPISEERSAAKNAYL